MPRIMPATALGLALACFASMAETRATPIEYRFSWQGSATLTQSLPNVAAEMLVEGHPSDVIEGVTTSGNFAFNGSGLGTFNGAGLSGQFPALVTRETDNSITSLTFQPPDRTYELGVVSGQNLPGGSFPGIDTYDLRSAFGPVNGLSPGLSGQPSFDFGAAGVLTFSNISSPNFTATTSSADAISYDFSWTGAATLATQLDNAQFSMIIQGDTEDVKTGDNFAFNRPVQPLIGTFNGAGLSGQFPALVTRETNNSITDLSFQPPDRTYELGVVSGQNLPGGSFPGIDTYDLRSAFGPVNGLSVGFTGLASFDFGAAGVLTFSNISSPSFEAVEIAAVPEPSSIALLGAGLVGLGAAIRRRRFTNAGP